MTKRIVIIGASGGIGTALAEQAEARGEVIRLSRPAISIDDDASFASAAEAAGDALTHVIVAAGLLHREAQGPERDVRQLDAGWMMENFRANSILPALAARHFLPRLVPQGRSVFAVLTARVGSIGDNRLGGWHSYRMAKAAANQLVRTLSIELKRKRPEAIAVALHPGTVDTGMSRPFQRNVPDGKLFTPAYSAERLWAVMDGLGSEDSGGFFDWKGEPIPW